MGIEDGGQNRYGKNEGWVVREMAWRVLVLKDEMGGVRSKSINESIYFHSIYSAMGIESVVCVHTKWCSDDIVFF